MMGFGQVEDCRSNRPFLHLPSVLTDGLAYTGWVKYVSHSTWLKTDVLSAQREEEGVLPGHKGVVGDKAKFTVFSWNVGGKVWSKLALKQAQRMMVCSSRNAI